MDVINKNSLISKIPPSQNKITTNNNQFLMRELSYQDV